MLSLPTPHHLSCTESTPSRCAAHVSELCAQMSCTAIADKRKRLCLPVIETDGMTAHAGQLAVAQSSLMCGS